MQKLIAALMSIFMTILSFFGVPVEKEGTSPAAVADDTIVSVIVELDHDALLEGVNSAAQREKLLADIETNEDYKAMEEAQEALKETIKTRFSLADFAASYSYFFVTNGFSLDIPYQYVDDLETLPGVKSVHLSASYQAPVEPDTVLPLDPLPVRHDDDGFSGIKAMHDRGYTGKGTVIAILDTGFQVDHKAFAAGVADPTYRKADIVKKSMFGFLNTIVPMFGAQYYSEKIPYRWDYASVDKNVYNGDNTHGTHVAGIVGGNSDTLLGAAPDAQLLLMKVFKDGANSLAKEYVILAALEDCIKLNADVVNMSLGSECGQEPDNIFTQTVVNRLRRAAINVVASAGNENSLSSFDAVFGQPMNAELFDYGTTNSPASYSHFMSVASARIQSTESLQEDVISLPRKGSLVISDFSAWGPTEDLRLKPEITAIGSDIYSSLNENTYGYMSGTSMSTPFYAGAAALMKQYIREQLGKMDKNKISEYINALLMSTATVFRAPGADAIYSPRRQGAGFINLEGALSTPAYLTQVDGVSRPKIELCELDSGVLTLAFCIHNRADRALTYDLSETVLMDNYRKIGSRYDNLVTSKALGADEVAVTALEGVDDGKVTVAPGESKTVRLRLSIDDRVIEAYQTAFVNGFFIDGFVFLKDPQGDNVTLSLPFMGFLGDWHKDMLYDYTIYDAHAPYLNGEWGLAVTDGKDYYPLGLNLFESGKETNVDRKYCAYSTKALGMKKPYVTVSIGLLRNAKRMDFNLFTESGIFRYCGSTLFDYCRKTISASRTNHGLLWGGKSGLINGHRYVYKVSTRAQNYDSGRQTISFPFVVDNNRPEILSCDYAMENGDRVLHIRIKDNHYVMGFELFTENDVSVGKVSFKGLDPDENGVYDYTVNVSDLASWWVRNQLDSLKIYTVDYAYNETYGAVTLSSATVDSAVIDRDALPQPHIYPLNDTVPVIDETE